MRPTSTGNALKRQPGNNALGLIGSGFQPNAVFEGIQKKALTQKAISVKCAPHFSEVE